MPQLEAVPLIEAGDSEHEPGHVARNPGQGAESQRLITPLWACLGGCPSSRVRAREAALSLSS
jgi:hypothetical protein